MANQRWLFVVRALDKPGTLTAAAAVFSNRGISLEGILGSGMGPGTAADGRLIFSFQATEAKQALLQKALERLPSVFQVRAYHYDDERLRAIAVAKLSQRVKLTNDDESYFVETIAQTSRDRMVMLTGSPLAVEAAVDQFRQQGHLKDVVMSYITV
ncbi:MAG TPA: ACT domain-containing protein [Leptolyngbyaceae cyanobacterium M65_K2018_010]|nr:ACT domain-containing protein [Leptolyngbyaceae cyanobacterium M65_K2018_010]